MFLPRLTTSILLCFCAALLSLLSARNVETHRGEIPRGYNYLLSVPDSVNEPKPLIVFLHGASLCGTNIERVKRYGPVDAIERGRKIDAFVVAPQNPGGGWQPAKIMSVVDHVKSQNNIDTTRIYVVGMSLGGYGTIDFTAAYPERIAAAIAICGGGTSSKLADLNKVPLWIVHGTADRAVSVAQSDNVVTAMKLADNNTPRLVYDRVPGVNHSEPARMFYLPEIYDWLFRHSLSDEGRPMHEPTHITRQLLGRAYAGVKSKPGTSKKNKTTRRRKSRRRR